MIEKLINWLDHEQARAELNGKNTPSANVVSRNQAIGRADALQDVLDYIKKHYPKPKSIESLYECWLNDFWKGSVFKFRGKVIENLLSNGDGTYQVVFVDIEAEDTVPGQWLLDWVVGYEDTPTSAVLHDSHD